MGFDGERFAGCNLPYSFRLEAESMVSCLPTILSLYYVGIQSVNWQLKLQPKTKNRVRLTKKIGQPLCWWEFASKRGAWVKMIRVVPWRLLPTPVLICKYNEYISETRDELSTPFFKSGIFYFKNSISAGVLKVWLHTYNPKPFSKIPLYFARQFWVLLISNKVKIIQEEWKVLAKVSIVIWNGPQGLGERR